jgi:hypothetical protein
MYVLIVRHFRLLTIRTVINLIRTVISMMDSDGQFVTPSHLVEEMHLACVIDNLWMVRLFRHFVITCTCTCTCTCIFSQTVVVLKVKS